MAKTYKKCPECGELNLNTELCSNCGAILDIRKRRKLERERKRKIKRPVEQKKNKLTEWFENAKNHQNIFVRLTARLFYSVWILMIAIAGVAAMIILYASA